MHTNFTKDHKNAHYLLITFAPSSGIGFYELEDKIYQFDLVTEEDSALQGNELIALRMEFDQIELGFCFDSLEDLLSFATREYLRDKKDNYYIILFTRHLSNDVRSQTLQLLNAPELCKIPITYQYIPILKEIADPQLVFSIIQQAYSLQLMNVKECMSKELHEIIFSELIMQLFISESLSENTCNKNISILLADYISVLEKIPESSLTSFKFLLDTVERQIEKIGSHEIHALEKIVSLVQYESPKIQFVFGMCYENLGRHIEAIIAFDKALEINPKFTETWHGKGAALYKLGRFDSAIECFDKALEINPNFIEAWNNKGTALYNLGKRDSAIECFDKALKLNPEFTEARHNKRIALGSIGRHQGAIESASVKPPKTNPKL